MKKNRISCVLCCVFLLLTCFMLPTHAAQGAQGFAIYHGRAMDVNLDWHAGIMHGSDFNATKSIIHEGKPDGSSNGEHGVHYCSKARFLNNQVFKGYYRPYDGISDLKRNSVRNTADKLTKYNISYTISYQMKHTDTLSGTRIQPSEITHIRCDGVVEYCYEYNICKIYGTGNREEWATHRDRWDISYKNTPLSVHSSIHISPKKQALSYMEQMLGDVDADCTVSSEDARLVNRAAVGLESFDSFQLFVGDVDGDGQITPADARLILRYSLGIIDIFPTTQTYDNNPVSIP